MKKIILVLSLILLSHIVIAQNVTMAKAFYKKAQKEFENKNYKEVITLLEKTVENLAGETNPDIIYLEAKSRFLYNSNVTESAKLFKLFLNQADQNDDRINEVSSILVDIETSNNYYSNGERKRFETISQHNGDKIVYFSFSDGYAYKMERYGKDRDFKLTSILYRKGKTKADRRVLRREYYDIDGNLESTEYPLSNGSVRVWGNGQHIQVYDKKNNLIQRYGYDANDKYKFAVDGGFYSFESFNSWKNDDFITFFQETSSTAISIEVLETHDYKDIIPIAQHQNLTIGPVKKLKVTKNDFNGITFKYVVQEILFGKDGVPIKKEHFNKRGKLKDSFIYNKENKSWIKQ